MPKVDVILGLQYGDEGKGKVTYHMIKNNNYDICARFNGGPNAGHTVYVGDQKLVTHQVPTGALHGIPSLIGSACVVDPRKLEEEITMINKALILASVVKNKKTGKPLMDIRDILFISYNAHVITEKHIEEDKKADKIGSTHCGIGPVNGDKVTKKGQRVENFLDENKKFCGCNIVDPIEFLAEKEDAKILMEGAQGFRLDINHGPYPFVTSGNCGTSSAFTDINPRSLNDVVGIAKIYETYVGQMKFQPEGDEILKQVAKVGKEFGATTGRQRQTRWLNLDELARTIKVNGVNKIIINKCDILEEVGKFKVVSSNKETEFDDLDKMKKYIETILKNDCKDLQEIIFSATALGI